MIKKTAKIPGILILALMTLIILSVMAKCYNMNFAAGNIYLDEQSASPPHEELFYKMNNVPLYIPIQQPSYETLRTNVLDDNNGDEWILIGEYRISHYCKCATCNGKWAGMTSTGATPEVGRTIAVNPQIIPYGTEVKINDTIYIAEDTGGAIRHRNNCIDILVESHEKAYELGVYYTEVYIKNES
jgi:3D (Asp-Asp-Asp) domain-containing protein